MRERLRGLYVIIDPEVAEGRDEVQIAREAIAGGATMIQLRDKTREKGEILRVAEGIAGVCRQAEALFIVNDHADVALAVSADGVHVGQKDLPVTVLRRLIGPERIVGASTNNANEARKAEADGADYVSVGRLFPTGSKADTRPATLETLRAVKASVKLPVCAIGGINESNIDAVIGAGAHIVSVIAAVVAAPDVRAAARALAKRFEA